MVRLIAVAARRPSTAHATMLIQRRLKTLNRSPRLKPFSVLLGTCGNKYRQWRKHRSKAIVFTCKTRFAWRLEMPVHSTSPRPMVLGDLADPTRYQSPIEILGRIGGSCSICISMLKDPSCRAEARTDAGARRRHRRPVHLGVGQGSGGRGCNQNIYAQLTGFSVPTDPLQCIGARSID